MHDNVDSTPGSAYSDDFSFYDPHLLSYTSIESTVTNMYHACTCISYYVHVYRSLMDIEKPVYSVNVVPYNMYMYTYTCIWSMYSHACTMCICIEWLIGSMILCSDLGKSSSIFDNIFICSEKNIESRLTNLLSQPTSKSRSTFIFNLHY